MIFKYFWIFAERFAPERRLAPKQGIKKTTGRLAPERRLIKKAFSQQEDWHPNRKSKTQQEDLAQKEDSLRKCFPTGRLTPKQEIRSPTGRLAPERRLIKKTVSQQEDWHPKRKSETQQEDLSQKEDSLRKCLPNRKTDTQTGNQEPSRKTCPGKKTH